MKLGIGALLLSTLSVANAGVITLSGSGAAVPDNNATGITLDLSTLDTRTVSGVELFFTDISHTYMGDLIVTLQHVGIAGPVAVLNRFGINPVVVGCSGTFGCSANLATGGTYTFATTGTALTSVPALSTSATNIPFATYASFESFAPLTGAAANGTWRLIISDNAAADTSNTTWTWGVNLTVDDVAGVPEPSTLSMFGVALGAIGLGLRRRR